MGLYSVTFNNRCELDHETLTQYKQFREEAERVGFRHFLEVFDPNLPDAVPGELVPGFVNDLVARTLAGVAAKGRPVFLKMVYHGPRALEELVSYDPHLVVGVLGGSAGTTLDAFQLIHDVRKYGGRAALFGRKINQAENQLAFIEFLRHIVDGVIEPVEAVKAYHAVLARLGLKPHRPARRTISSRKRWRRVTAATPTSDRKTGRQEGVRSRRLQENDAEERLAYHQARLNRLFGESG